MQKEIIDYLSKGLALTNKSFDILLISIVMSLIGFIPYFLGESDIGSILQIPFIFYIFIQAGYGMSIPLFFVEKQHHKPLDVRQMWSITLRNTKRMIIPGILLFILIIGGGVFFVFLIASITTQEGGDAKQMITVTQNLTQSFYGWNPILLLLTTLTSFFVFTPMYFSMENKGFFRSVKSSVVFSIKHFKFLLLIMLLTAISYSLSSLIPTSPENQISIMVKSVIGMYFAFIMTASSLVYYQSKNKEESKR